MAGRSTDEMDFSGSYSFDWSQLPRPIRSSVPDQDASVAACDIDESVRTVRRRRQTHEFYQPVTIWRATRAGISLIRLRRTLRPAGTKSYQPTGELQLDDVDHRPAASNPRLRRGEVTDSPRSAADRGAEPLVDEVDFIDYLPGAVRAEVEALVPGPTYRHGNLVQYSTDGKPHRQLLRMIRMREDAAVVVVAERALEFVPTDAGPDRVRRMLATLPWTVARYAYELGPRHMSSSGQAGGPDVTRELR